MTRQFTGGRSNFSSLTSKESHRKDVIDGLLRKKRGEREVKQTQESRYNKMVEEKMAEIKAKVSKSTRVSVQLPGVAPGQERELSKSAQDVVEQMAKMQAQKHAKKNKFKHMVIRPRMFTGMQGGRIDNKGRIYGPDGRYIAFVCKKSGKVKGRNGNTICYRYADSSFCDYKISRFIQWSYDKKRMKNSIYAVNGFTTLGGGVYGSAKSGVHGGGQNAGAGLWGAGGGWGNNNAGGGVWGGGGGWGNTNNSGGGVWGGGGGWGGDTGGFWG